MKTVKIAPAVHTELKLFVAAKSESISDVAGYAIMLYLKNCGHKFTVSKKKVKNDNQ